MTAVTSSVAPIDHRHLINAILELPEKEFWDIVDLRLNRPNGLRAIRRQQEDNILELLQQEKRQFLCLLPQWLRSYIEDNLYLEMCEVEIAEDPEHPEYKIHRYYLEAAKYAGRISAGNFDSANAKYKPVFEIHYNYFTPRLQAELQQLLKDSPSTLAKVVQNAVFRIFRARHKRIFFEYIEGEGLNWRFVTN